MTYIHKSLILLRSTALSKKKNKEKEQKTKEGSLDKRCNSDEKHQPQRTWESTSA